MPPVSRHTDKLKTGHGCTPITTLDTTHGVGAKVFANKLGVACLEDPTVSHTYPDGVCVPHVVNLAAASPTVFVGGIAVGRVGDAIDAGSMIQGSPNVFANGGAGSYTPPTLTEDEQKALDDLIELEDSEG